MLFSTLFLIITTLYLILMVSIVKTTNTTRSIGIILALYIIILLYNIAYYSIFLNSELLLSILLLMIILVQKTLPFTTLIILTSFLGVILSLESNNLIGIYLSIELYSISTYILCTTNSSSAGVKYFLLSALSSGIGIAGISLIYLATGSLDLNQISNIIIYNGLYPGNGLMIGTYLLAILLIFKLGGAPFHFWLPDVYSKVDLIINYYLIIIPKVGLFILLIKLSIFTIILKFSLLTFGIISLIVGSIGGNVQVSLRRLLAYSSISHLGYLLIFLYALINTAYIKNGSLYYSTTALSGLIQYLIVYSIILYNIFAIINIISINYIYFLNRYNALYLYASLTLAIFSAAGIPPTAGFIIKLNLLTYITKTSVLSISIITIVSSIISMIYYLSIIKNIYISNDKAFAIKNIDNFSALSISYSTLLLSGVYLYIPYIPYLSLYYIQ